MAFLTGKRDRIGTSLVALVHFDRWVGEEHFHNLRVSEPASTMAWSISLLLSNPVYINPIHQHCRPATTSAPLTPILILLSRKVLSLCSKNDKVPRIRTRQIGYSDK